MAASVCQIPLPSFQNITAHLAHVPPALHCYQFNSDPLGFPLTAPTLPTLRRSQDAHHRQKKGKSRQFSVFSSAERDTLRLSPCETAFPDQDISAFHVGPRCFSLLICPSRSTGSAPCWDMLTK